MELSSDAFTVVVANDEEDGQRVHQLAQSWHRDGLLTDFAWVTPGSVERGQWGPATVTASVMGSSEPVELLALLGSRRRTLIRLVVLHLLTHEDVPAGRLVDACDRVADLVRRAMPVRITTSDTGPPIRLLRVNLMVPESDLAPQQLDILQPGWEVNAVVSPEDRPDLDRLSVFVRSSTNLHGHALAAAAAAGALWKGMPNGAFDGHELDSTSGGKELVVLRAQARIVVGDHRAENLARATSAKVLDSPDGAARFVPWGFPADNPRDVVESTLARLQTSSEWAVVERHYDPLEKRQVSIASLIQDWADFQLRLPLAAARFFGWHARTAVEQSMTNAVIGADAGVIGRLTPVVPEEAVDLASARLKGLSEQLMPQRLQQDAASWGQTTPTAWRELREVSIGLVDGSRLPDRFVRQRRAELDEVLPPVAIVPDPDDRLHLSWAPDLRAVDVRRVATVVAEAEARESETSAAAAADATAAIATEAEEPVPPRRKTKPAKQALHEKEEETKSEAQPSTPPRPTAAAEAHAQASTELDHVKGWVARRKDSLFWRLATRVYDARRTEEQTYRRAEKEVQANSQTPDAGKLKAARRVLIGSWIVTLACLLFIPQWFWVKSENPDFPFLPERTWQNLVRFLVLLVLIFLGAGHNYYRALRAYEWSVRSRMHALRNASDEYVAARQQEKRWALMYSGVLDWADILATLLHHPWDRIADETEAAEGHYTGLPASVAVAVPVDESLNPTPDIVVRAVEAVCQRGWLLEEFHRYIGRSHLNDPTVSGGSGDLQADLDLGLRPHGPRADLLKVSRQSVVRHEAGQDLMREIGTLVSSGVIMMPDQNVTRIGPYSAGDVVKDAEFLSSSNNFQAPLSAELFSDSAQVQGVNTPERSVFTLPVGVPSPNLRGVEVDFAGVSLATRVDVSQLVRPSEIRIFERTARGTVYAQPESDDFN